MTLYCLSNISIYDPFPFRMSLSDAARNHLAFCNLMAVL